MSLKPNPVPAPLPGGKAVITVTEFEKLTKELHDNISELKTLTKFVNTQDETLKALDKNITEKFKSIDASLEALNKNILNLSDAMLKYIGGYQQ